MTRDQMIAWLTLEGWACFSTDSARLLGVDNGRWSYRRWRGDDTDRWTRHGTVLGDNDWAQEAWATLTYPFLSELMAVVSGGL